MAAPMIVKCPDVVIAGSLITKEKRHEMFGAVAGGAGSSGPEKFQRVQIIMGTGYPCPKTNMRINLRTHTLKDIAHPNTSHDGFDYSENFDGLQIVNAIRLYLNLKCVVGSGGSQTRTLREVYWFLEGQLQYLVNTDDTTVFFANILDGDEAHDCMSKFEYLLSMPEFAAKRHRVYVGDLKGYFDWFKGVVGG